MPHEETFNRHPFPMILMRTEFRVLVLANLLALLLAHGINAAEPDEALYNGIVLPSPWFPQPAAWPRPEPVTPPYLLSPPAVIRIDVGRQLFVDDFLFEDESLLLGAFSINTANPDKQTGRPKINQVKLGYSRDGFHCHRPDRRVFLPVSENTSAWNWGNVQSVGGVCLVVGDRLHFYVSGRTGGTNSVGLALLRRDGFASMDSGAQEGTLTTRPVRFRGKHLFVNVDDPQGELRVEVLNQAGQVVAPFIAGACEPVTADRTLQMVSWEGVKDLSSLVNQPVRFRFRLKNGRLYAFWVSPEASRASRGYVAAGGPGFSGNRDLGTSAGRN